MPEGRGVILGCDVQRRRLAAALGTNAGDLAGTVYRDLPTGEDFREWTRAVSDAFRDVERVATHHGADDVLAVFIEGAYMGTNRRHALGHAEAIGAARVVACRAWPWALAEVLPASTVRSVLGIAPRGKDAVTVWALATYPGHGLEDSPQDVRDAVAVMAAGRRVAEVVT
jgi:Holliday junction resolvasome RuvABC endonuclease subunit